MNHFESDYLEGAHPKILERLVQTNFEKTPGYGSDHYCQSAKDKIREICKIESNAAVYFLAGGTQTNLVMIKTLLRSYEAVICACSAHINEHEAGAIEAGGHKVLPIPSKYGKLDVNDVRKYLEKFHRHGGKEQMVQPGMIYITHPTEYGFLYSKKELEDFRALCDQYGLLLYLDGARLGYGLASDKSDLTIENIARLTDAFYIGGTKIGALFGEAVVAKDPELLKHFPTILRQSGALIAKGRILGIQFDTLFSDNLYMELASHALKMAEKIKKGLESKGYEFYYESPTNLQFVIVKNDEVENFIEQSGACFWEEIDDDRTVLRLVTSWATKESDIDYMLSHLPNQK